MQYFKGLPNTCLIPFSQSQIRQASHCCISRSWDACQFPQDVCKSHDQIVVGPVMNAAEVLASNFQRWS